MTRIAGLVKVSAAAAALVGTLLLSGCASYFAEARKPRTVTIKLNSKVLQDTKLAVEVGRATSIAPLPGDAHNRHLLLNTTTLTGAPKFVTVPAGKDTVEFPITVHCDFVGSTVIFVVHKPGDDHVLGVGAVPVIDNKRNPCPRGQWSIRGGPTQPIGIGHH